MRFFELEGVKRWQLSTVFIIKIAFGTGMYFLYTTYYPDRSTADIFKYFDDSKVMYDALWTNPADFFKMLFSIGNDSPYFDTNYYSNMNNWYREFESNVYNDSHTIIRFNALLHIFSFGSYHAHTVFMCFLSLIGLTSIFKALQAYFVKKELWLGLAIFLIPSVLFWGSGVLKEGLVILGMGLLLFYYMQFLNKKYSIIGLLLVLFSLVLLFHMKFYVLMALIPGLVAFWWVQKTNGKLAWAKYLGVLVVLTIVGLNIHHLIPEYHVLYLLARKQADFIGLAEFQESGSVISVARVHADDLMSFIKAAPQAFSNSFFRPVIGENTSAMMLFAGLENAFIAIVTLVSIIFIKPLKNINWNLVLFCASFVIILFILIGWTTPVMGAIVRYKVPALPFLLILCFQLLDTDKVSGLIKRMLKR